MKKILYLSSIILPPFLLMPLHRFPVDLGSIGSFLSLIAFIVFVKSVITLVKALYVSLLRPVLAISIIILNIFILRASLKSADLFAEKTANQVQKTCNENKLCPDTIDGFTAIDQRVFLRYGEYGSKYYIYYEPSEDNETFTLRVRHNIDQGLVFKGGINQDHVSKKIQY